MNTFMNALSNNMNYGYTQNGALAHKSTNSAVYDMFATGGAYRNRPESDCILLFKNAFEENESLAMKCLFYLRDCRGGQGERRFFRTCFKWLCDAHTEAARRNLEHLSEYGRWDDLIYTTIGTPLQNDALNIIKHQLALDIQCNTPSLLAKWMPSENASSAETKRVANIVRNYFGMTHKEYRKSLSILRQRINVLERLMSQNRWEEIEFDKIPSKAGLIYKNAFARRDIIAKKYEAFAKSANTKVNAATLYPYEIVKQAIVSGYMSATDRAMIEKYWDNLPDYFNGKSANMMCVVDTSGSMTWASGCGDTRPIDVAISLGMYCAERLNGPFKNRYISFSSVPQLIKIEGIDFVDKVQRIYRTNLCENTNLTGVFDLLKRTALQPGVNKDDLPETIVVISDMQIDSGTYIYGRGDANWTRNGAVTEMERVRAEWAAAGLKMPKLIYWNVNAYGEANILDASPNVSYVSGCSPVIFKSVLTGKTGWDLCLEVLNSKRYEVIM